jgi:tetratricopeptide (TPR) repeat protein
MGVFMLLFGALPYHRAAFAQTQSTDPWAGKKAIVTPSREVELREGDKVVGKINAIIVTVKQTQGEWVWVSTLEGNQGWLLKSEVMLLDQAEQLLTDNIRREPRTANWYYLRAMVRNSHDKHEECIADANRTLQLQPDHDQAYNILGLAHWDLKQHDQAIAAFERGLQLEPADEFLNYHKAALHWDMKQEDLALQQIERLMQHHPEFAYPFRWRAVIKLEQGKVAAAAMDFSTARRMDPEDKSDRGMDIDEEAWMILEFDALYDALAEAGADEIARFIPVDYMDWEMRAWAWRETKHYDRALSDYQSALKLAKPTQYGFMHRQLGNTQYLLGHLAEARAEYDAAIQLSPQETDYFDERGLVRFRQGDESGTFDDWNYAVTHPQRISAGPTAHDLLNRGWMLYRRGERQAATADYVQARDQWFSRGESDPAPWFASDAGLTKQLAAERKPAGQLNAFELTLQGELALRNSKLDKLKGAAVTPERSIELRQQGLAGLTAAIDADEEFALPAYCRGMLREREKLWPVAVEDFSEAIRRDEQFGHAYFERGYCKMQGLQQYTEALADFQRAIDLKALVKVSYLNRGWCLSQLDQDRAALTEFDAALKIDPQYALGYLNRGWSWHRLKEYDAAIADFDVAIKVNSKYILAYHDRGKTWKAKREYTKALSDFRQAIKLDPKRHDTYVELTWMLATYPDAQGRDGQQAITYGKQACELTQWKDANDLCNLACAYAEAGDFAEAVKWQTKANELFTPEQKAKWGFLLEQFQAGKPYRDEKS